MLPAAGSGAKDLAPPQTIDRYQIGGCIGRGGMAEVYRGTLVGVGGFERVVAVKVLLPQLSAETEFVNMLLDEARIAGTIHHGNVVQVLDVGQDGPVFYLVMEYIDGIDLRSVEKRHERGQVPLEPLLFIIAEVLRGLDAIHNARDGAGELRKIVHRDVTPSNVLLTMTGAVKLADFGIAHATGRLTQTRHGAVKGKARYMAPEQLDGKSIDHRTDLFAMGVVLLEALLGRDAADAWHSTAMGPIFKIPWRVPPQVPRDLGVILSRALAGPREDRYQSAAEFRRDVLRVLSARTQERRDLVPYSADQLEAFLRPLLARGEAQTAALLRPGSAGRGAEKSGSDEPSEPSRPDLAPPQILPPLLPGPSTTLSVPPPQPPPSATLPVVPPLPGLPFLSTEADPATATAAPHVPPPTTQTVPLSMLTGAPTQATVTLPMVSGAIDGTQPPRSTPREATLPVAPSISSLALLADDEDSAQAATAVTSVTAAMRPPLSEQMTIPPQPASSTSAYQHVPELRPSLRATLSQVQDTLVRTLRGTVLRPASGRPSLKLLAMVLAGVLLGVIGLIVLVQAQGQKREAVVVPRVEAPRPPPPAAPPPPPPIGQLHIGAPPGTRVFIDGVIQPELAPHTYDVSPGPHKLRIQSPRRREVSRSIEIQAGRTEQIKL